MKRSMLGVTKWLDDFPIFLLTSESGDLSSFNSNLPISWVEYHFGVDIYPASIEESSITRLRLKNKMHSLHFDSQYHPDVVKARREKNSAKIEQ